MKVEVLHQPDSAIAHINLAPQEELIAGAGSMVAMSGNLDVSTTLRKGKGGGVFGGALGAPARWGVVSGGT